MQKGFVKISNSIFEYGLTSSELLVYCYLSSKCWLLPYVTIKQSTIAAAVGLSRNTVMAALAGLDEKELIEKRQRYFRGYRVSNSYCVCRPSGGWFRLPKAIFSLPINKSDFAVYLYILRCANKKGKGFPSTSTIAYGCGISEPRIRMAIKALSRLCLLHKKHYLKLCGAFGCNNFRVLTIRERQALLTRYRKRKRQSIAEKLWAAFFSFQRKMVVPITTPKISSAVWLFCAKPGRAVFLRI
ncbi:helix-turn-helix domain-containing protein (plasmid) [Oscillospiraceae bacterium MB08-C2-2]|nr:helix-turn-helix domain-containing protein [Oscillospiraceae bacterium MB08-C2-2]